MDSAVVSFVSKKLKTGIKATALVLSVLPSIALASPFETDLNGFRLWQYVSGAESHLGKPFKTIEQPDRILQAFKITENSYMVFANPKEEFKHYVSSIQISGYPTKMFPFKGLTLGDSKAKVEKALGKPSETKTIYDGKFIVNYYKLANYSTEYDEHGKLYSIKLHVTNEFMKAEDYEFKSWQRFKKAVLEKDVPAIIETLRPDAEIFQGGDTLSHHGRYLEFRTRPDAKFVDALIGSGNSVRTALTQTEPEGEMRVAMGLGVGQVFKFYKSDVLREIVLFPYNGEYRVYEIAFRARGEKAEKPGK
ncbi:MAG: hypothetical protein ACU836_17910 [Gammaproteobacteria bacterium]